MACDSLPLFSSSRCMPEVSSNRNGKYNPPNAAEGRPEPQATGVLGRVRRNRMDIAGRTGALEWRYNFTKMDPVRLRSSGCAKFGDGPVRRRDAIQILGERWGGYIIINDPAERRKRLWGFRPYAASVFLQGS